MRERFRSAGVDINRPGVTTFLNGRERNGILLVFATKKDLDTIESLLAVINTPPPQVNIKMKWVEFTQNDIRGLGLNSFLGNLSLGNRGGATASTDSVPSYQGTSSTANSSGQFFRILTDAQHRVLLDKFISQRDGADGLSQGDITTVSGRECRFQTIEMKTIVTGINPQALIPPGVNSTTNVLERQTSPFGQTLNVIPTVSPEETQISLHVIAYANEFLGYGKTKSNVPVYVNGKKKAEVPPLPPYRAHQITNDFVMRDGQTLMLGNLPTTEVARQPNGEFLTTDVTGTKTKFLFVFVTPTLIDPAGNRVNTGGK